MHLSKAKFTALFTVITILWAPFLHADDSNSLTYKRGQVPTAEERESLNYSNAEPDRRIWTRLSFFQTQSIEIVKDGKVDEFWSPRLTLNGQFKEWMASAEVSLSDFEWLQLREVDVSEAKVQFNQNQFIATIPVAFGIRYKTSLLYQGTVNVIGTLTVKGSVNGVIDSINLVAFDDSQFLERTARSLWLLGDFDAAFVQGFSIPILQSYFSTDANLSEALTASGALTKIEGGTLPLN